MGATINICEKKVKISIIVPVYNVEEFVGKCLTSLVKQDADKNLYEVIVINDGSTDDSLSKVAQIEWKGTCHTILSRENRGLSQTRNEGIRTAKGDYVWFVDSDDWISTDCLGNVIAQLQGQDVMAFLAYYRECQGQTTLESYKAVGTDGRMFTKGEYKHAAPFYVYRRGFLLKENCFFRQGILHEDTLFSPVTLYKAQSITVYTEPVYHYLMRDGSITSQSNPKRIYDLMKIIAILLDFARESVVLRDRKDWYNGALGTSLNGLLFQSVKCMDMDVRESVRRFVDNREICRIFTYSHSIRTRIMGFIALIYGCRLYKVYTILARLRY